MPTKIFRSRHIHLDVSDASLLGGDIDTFSSMVRKATQLLKKENKNPGIDLRTVSGRVFAAGNGLPQSVFKQLKSSTGLKTYYVNSAVNAAKGNIRSCQELRKERIGQARDRIKKIENKISKTQKQLDRLMRTKLSIIEYSRAIKYGKKPCRIYQAPMLHIDTELNQYQVKRFGKVLQSYGCLYDFELQYLDVQTKNLKSRIRNLCNRLEHNKSKLDRLCSDSSWHICYGTRSYLKKKDTVYDDHRIWKAGWQKRRSRSMCISGRRDLPQGNPVCRYDTDTNTLTYTSMSGRRITMRCEFPYGQEEVNNAIDMADGYGPMPIAWCFEKTGKSFIVKCIIDVPSRLKNFCYSGGCIGIDTNYDNLSLAETDGNGSLLNHEIIHFDIEDASTNKTKHVLSNTMERIFRYAEDRNKPIVMEDLKIKDRSADYRSNKKQTKKISSFASTRITELMLSKSGKYGIEVKTVHPAYTSFIGKLKYRKRYGLSTHESASYVIARRGMELEERIPKDIKRKLPAGFDMNQPKWQQWKQMYKTKLI